jgi:uncharacterized protein with beta-barrel porin domain
VGYVNNQVGGIIQGGQNGAYLFNDGGVVNAGTITGVAGIGVYIYGADVAPDWVNNLPGGIIRGGSYGVYVDYPGSVTNAGSISGAGNDGVYTWNGTVLNYQGGVIAGNVNGVTMSGTGSGTETVLNSGTIIGTNNDGVYLGGGGDVENAVGATIRGGLDGVEVQGNSGTVDNSGAITGFANNGVYMGDGGSVNNYLGGSILSGGNGVDIAGGSGAVYNAGTITGTNGIGVHLEAGGSVANASGAAIYGGGHAGVQIEGGTGAVANQGSIASSWDGVYLGDGGSVVNYTNGTITGAQENGVTVYGGAGFVTNAGTITGGRNGVRMADGGVVENLAAIYGGNDGVKILGDVGVVNNSGTITGTNGFGVYMGAGGSVINYSGAAIYGGGHAGVQIEGGAGSVANQGSIASSWDGVYLGSGGSVVNYTGGTITGPGQNGVTIYGGAGFVTNAGSITGGRNGVRLADGGVVENLATITGGNDGVKILGDVGVVNNSGTITGTGNDGVYLGDGGSVNNYSGATIVGGVNGVETANGIATVANAGTILDDSNDGVLLGLGGTVTNFVGGIIGGNHNGVEFANAVLGTVVNSGTITGTNNNGVYFSDTGSYANVINTEGGIINSGGTGVNLGGDGGVLNAGTITGVNGDGVYIYGENYDNDWVNNLAGGIIQGGSYGIYVDYPSYVTNAGSISGAGNDGVNMWSGTVVNYQGGVIAGNGNGVTITGEEDGTGTVLNSGTIIGTNNAGVYMGDGGSVYNTEGALISGGTYGVYITGSPGSVLNSGTIVDTGIEYYDGVYLGAGGSVSNLTGGYISGGVYGVQIAGGPGNVVNAGTIIGNSDTAILLDNYNNTVTFQTGSYVWGDTVGGNTPNDAAILQGHGEYDWNYYNFETLDVQGDPAHWNEPWNSWDLTGYSIFSTNAVVETGLLRINGSLTTPLLTVDNSWAGGSLDAPFLTNSSILDSDTTGLGGSGIIVGNVDNHGYISPGNSIGTMTIIGSYTNGGNYYAEVANTGASDHIAVSDAAVINDGNVVVETTAPTFDPAAGNAGIYAVQTKYTLLTATNGRSGMFVTSSIVQPEWSQSPLFPLIGSSLLYDPTNVYLVLNRTPFNSVARTINQHSVAGALDGVGVVGLSPTMANLVYEFYWLGSASQAQHALDSLSGEIHGSMGLLNVQQQGAFNNTIAQRTGRISVGGGSGEFATSWKPVLLASAGSTPPPMPEQQVNQPWDFWMQGIGSFGKLKNDGNATGGNYTISGMSGGMDYRVNPELLLGLGMGYSHDDAGVGGPGANGTADAYQIGAYGGYVSGPWHLDSILSYGFLNTDTKRFINVGPIHQEADGSYDGGVFSVSAEGGYAFKFDWLTVEPTVGLDYAHLFQGGFAETGTASDGNNYGLNVKRVKMDSLRSSLGVRLAGRFGKPDGVQFIPALNGVWKHEFADRYADLNASFVGGSGDFVVRGVELGADTAVLGAGLTVEFNKTIQGFANYNANLNSKNESSTISGGLGISW